MKILLTTLNSQYIHSNLAVRYLYEAAKPYHASIEVREFTINNEENYIFEEILTRDYAVIALSCYIWNISQVLQLVDTIKKVSSQAVIILGGPEVSFDSRELMEKNRGIDYIIRGEGEKTFPQLIHALLEKKTTPEDLARIKGITYKIGTEILSNEDQELEHNLDNIPFPYQSLAMEDKIIYYETSRGCPYGCSYCLSSIHRGVRYFSMERVRQDLIFFLEKKVKQVKFVDRTFNADNQRALEIMKFLHENDNGITNFHFEVNGDILTQQMIHLISQVRQGLFQMEIGVQSTHEATIRAIDRKVDFQKIAQNVEALKKTGKVHLHLDLIAGLPLESFQRFRQSFNDVYALRPDDLQLGFLKMLKGSKIRSQMAEHGYIVREKEPYEVLGNHYISPGEIIQLKRVENILDKYYNSPGFKNTLDYIICNHYPDSFQFYQDLSDYWIREGCHHRSNSKDALYQILRNFSMEKKFMDQDLLEELLIYDTFITIKNSRRITPDKHLASVIHQLLHQEVIVHQLGFSMEEFKAKEYLKSINFYQFKYAIHEFALERKKQQACKINIRKASYLNLFDYREENILGEYRVLSLEWQRVMEILEGGEK